MRKWVWQKKIQLNMQISCWTFGMAVTAQSKLIGAFHIWDSGRNDEKANDIQFIALNRKSNLAELLPQLISDKFIENDPVLMGYKFHYMYKFIAYTIICNNL